MSNEENGKIDPIRKSHFKPLENAEKTSEALFYIGALLSFSTVLINPIIYPNIHIAASYLFIIIIVIFFFLNIIVRLYLFPRAEDARRKDFLSNSFGFNLTDQRTVAYYNNEEESPARRMGLSVLENLLYTKTILQHMATSARKKTAFFFIIWISLVIYRDSTLILITTIAVTLFSEEIIAKWLRIEWALHRAEQLFESAHRLLQSKPDQDKLLPYIVEIVTDYESGKALGGILLSDKIFNKLNPVLIAEWEKIKKGL